MKLTLPRNVSNLKTVEELGRFTQIAFDDIDNVLNGNVEFIENISVKKIDCLFSQANADTVFQHGLGRTPAGFFVVGLDVASIIYNATTANTTDLIYLRSSIANVNAKVMVY